MIKPSLVYVRRRRRRTGHNKMNASRYCKTKKKKVLTRDEEEKQTEDRALFTDT